MYNPYVVLREDAKVLVILISTRRYSACSFIGFSHGLSTRQQYFPLTTNQCQPGLSAQKPISDQVDCLNVFNITQDQQRQQLYI